MTMFKISPIVVLRETSSMLTRSFGSGFSETVMLTASWSSSVSSHVVQPSGSLSSCAHVERRGLHARCESMLGQSVQLWRFGDLRLMVVRVIDALQQEAIVTYIGQNPTCLQDVVICIHYQKMRAILWWLVMRAGEKNLV